MIKTNNKIMSEAFEALSGKWGVAIGISLVYILLTSSLQYVYPPFNLGILSFLLAGPLSLGFAMFALSVIRKEETRFRQLFDGFNHLAKALAAYLLITLFVLLGFILLIVPGIIIGIMLSQTFYILADDKDISVTNAMQKSSDMMYGYKWQFFGLILRYVGLGFLCLLTLGLGFILLAPYAQVCSANFYEYIKDRPQKQAL